MGENENAYVFIEAYKMQKFSESEFDPHLFK